MSFPRPLLLSILLISCIISLPPSSTASISNSPFLIEHRPQVIEQGRTWEVAAIMSEEATLQFVTSCERSLAGHDFPPSSSSSIPPSSSVPNATYVASVFLTTQFPITLLVNSTDVQNTEKLSNGWFITTLLTNGTDVCQSPRLLTLVNNNITKTEFHLWWTLTETVQVNFYNRVPIYLPPGRTHSIIVNTTNFPLSNMIVTEVTINNKDHAADIAKIYVNRNALATPYAHLHGCPTSQYNVFWKGSPLTQYVVVIPPSIYDSPNATSWDDHNPDFPHQPHHYNAQGGSSSSGLTGKKLPEMPWLEEKFLSSPSNAPQLPRPFFFIWLENTSNFTLNYTIQVTQTSETQVALTQPQERFESPYSFAAFYEFSYAEVLRTMDLVKTPYDSETEVELVFDLTQYQEAITERTPTIALGIGFYPTSLRHTARATTISVLTGSKPYVEIFIRLTHRLKLSQLHLSSNTSFHLRLDGVAYSTQGYVFQPMLIRPKIIDSAEYYRVELKNVSQEWVLFHYAPPSPTGDPNPGSNPSPSGNLQLPHPTSLETAKEKEKWASQDGSQRDLISSSSSSSSSSLSSSSSAAASSFHTVKFILESGMNPKIQGFSSSKGFFPNEVTHDAKFEVDGDMLSLCMEFDMESKAGQTFTLWNPDPSRSNMSVIFSFRETGPCLMTLSPIIKPLPKTTLVILLTFGSILALLLIIAACYLCARPSKTEFLTASEEEANNIRTMSRRHREVQAQEAGEFDKVPFLVRDNDGYPSSSTSTLTSTETTSTSSNPSFWSRLAKKAGFGGGSPSGGNRGGSRGGGDHDDHYGTSTPIMPRHSYIINNDDDDDDYDESDGLIGGGRRGGVDVGGRGVGVGGGRYGYDQAQHQHFNASSELFGESPAGDGRIGIGNGALGSGGGVSSSPLNDDSLASDSEYY